VRRRRGHRRCVLSRMRSGASNRELASEATVFSSLIIWVNAQAVMARPNFVTQLLRSRQSRNTRRPLRSLHAIASPKPPASNDHWHAPLSAHSMIELPDSSGLICGFRLRAEQSVEPINTSAGDWLNCDGPVWLHFNLADSRAQRWIAECPCLPEAARGRLLSDDRHVGLHPAGPGLAGALGDVHFEFETDPEQVGLLRVYVDEDRVITGRLHPLKIVDHLRREFLAGATVPTPILVLIRHVEELAELLDAVAVAQGDVVEEIEDRLLKHRGLQDGSELGRVRRLLARLRRQVGAQRQALAHLSHHPPRWCGEQDVERLRRATERIEGVAQDLEATQERSRLVQEEISNCLNEATNRNLYVLSIITAIFLPITLVTGIFGMNVGGLPWLEHPGGFAWVMAVMTLTTLATLGVLHWRKFF
jgi:zinc transporter